MVAALFGHRGTAEQTTKALQVFFESTLRRYLL